MKNNHIWPMSVRSQYGRICRKCFNANPHDVLMVDEARNRQRMTCPECGFVTEKDHAQGSYEMRDGKTYKDGKEVVLKTNAKGHAWMEEV